MSSRNCFVVVIGFAMSASSAAQADVMFLGTGTLPGTTTDLSGLDGKLEDGTPHNRLGGLGSGIAYAGRGNTYLLASDRGPVDGASDYRCRIHQMEIRVRPGAKPPVELKLTETRLLSSEKGLPLIGAHRAISTGPKANAFRYDPEAIRAGPSGTFFLADEYGPHIDEFASDGKRVRSFPVPMKFVPENSGSRMTNCRPRIDAAVSRTAASRGSPSHRTDQSCSRSCKAH